MLISSMSFKRFCFLLISIFTTLIFYSVAIADVPSSSIKMPKASKSMLLDIEAAGSKVIVVGERGHILLSDDQGQTWVQADVPVIQMLNAVDFANENLGWAVGHDGNIVHSHDGGETWVLQRDGLKAQKQLNISALSVAKQKVKDLEALIEQVSLSDAEVEEVIEETLLEEDLEGIEKPLSLEEQLDEANWELETAQERLDSVVIAPPLMDVWFADEKNGWAVGAFGTLLQTTDAGNTWVERNKDINNSEGYHLNAVFGAGGTIFIAGEAGFLIYSQDNGETWIESDLGYDGTIFGLLASPDGSFVIATGLRGNTFRTEDGGLTWQPLNPTIDYSLSNGFIYESSHVVLVGTGGSIAISEDKGDTFKKYTLASRSSLSSVIALENGQFLLVGQGGVHHFDINAVAE
jgi:photosystem II stability/assembly factor-like uncharacterized protein